MLGLSNTSLSFCSTSCLCAHRLYRVPTITHVELHPDGATIPYYILSRWRVSPSRRHLAVWRALLCVTDNNAAATRATLGYTVVFLHDRACKGDEGKTTTHPWAFWDARGMAVRPRLPPINSHGSRGRQQPGGHNTRIRACLALERHTGK